jgi:hypothetical protein
VVLVLVVVLVALMAVLLGIGRFDHDRDYNNNGFIIFIFIVVFISHCKLGSIVGSLVGARNNRCRFLLGADNNSNSNASR